MNTNIKTTFPINSDSYKVGGHWMLAPEDLKITHSYFEARKGAKYPYTVFFGLQMLLLDHFVGQIFNGDDIDRAYIKMKHHFYGNDTLFNYESFKAMYLKHEGKLPIRIRAVPEGTKVPINNVLFCIENTDDEFPWMTNFCETILTHIWYATTVATKSHFVKQMMIEFLKETSDIDYKLLIPYMLHDFGFRGAACEQQAGRGGAAHLVNFLGTDTIVGMEYAEAYYDADYETLGKSIFATEHSVMTRFGRDGELSIVQKVAELNPVGFCACVADSFDYYRHVKWFSEGPMTQVVRDRAALGAEKGIPTRWVIRPDSVTPEHDTPEKLVVWTFQELYKTFGTGTNSKGYKTLESCIGVIWGDGIDDEGIRKILLALVAEGFSVENIAFGMGGGLLQKVNRDTQRFAFKVCAEFRGDDWVDVQKIPLDPSKASKAGRLALTKDENGEFITVRLDELGDRKDYLETVFENGVLLKFYTFDEIREAAGF